MSAAGLTAAGLATTATVAAANTTQRATTTLNLKTKNSGVSYTFYGALGIGSGINPRIADAPITMQVSADNVHWKSVWVTTTNAVGDYTFYVTLAPAHTYFFRACNSGSATYRETSSPTVRVDVPQEKIVCVGDSITRGIGNGTWVTVLQQRLGPGWIVINEGVGGNSAGQMETRFANDAIALHPNFVVIMAGSNRQTLAETESNITEMCVQAHRNAMIPVMCLDPPYTRYLNALNAWTAEYANAHGYKVIDFYSVTNDPNNPGHYLPQYYYDGVHPNGAGYQAMGNSINLSIFTGQ